MVVVVRWLIPGRLVVIDGTVSPELYQKILKEKVRLSVHCLMLKHTQVIQKDKDLDPPLDDSKKIFFLNFLEWPHKSPDLKSIEMLETPPVWLNENNSAKNSGPIFPHCDVKDSLLPMVPVVEQPLLGRVFFSLMKIII